jgi:hypothetical protein
MKANTNIVSIDGLSKPVTIRELTVADMRAMLKARESLTETAADPLELLLIEDGLLLSDIPMITDLAVSDLDAIGEDGLGKLVDEMKRINPRFFAQTLATYAKIVRANLKGIG